MPETTESPARTPGWTKVTTGTSNKYRSPHGEMIGDWAYRNVYAEYKRTGVAPTGPRTNRAGISRPFSPTKSSTNTNYDDLDGFEDIDTTTKQSAPHVEPIDLPQAKPTPKRDKDRYSSRQLADGLGTVLIIATSLLAVVSNIPEAQMRENEVKAIAIPLSNIIERSQLNMTIGKLIVGNSDYAMLAYALFTYADRVTTAARSRSAKPSGTTGEVATDQGRGVERNGTFPGVPNLPYSPSGLRRYTPTV